MSLHSDLARRTITEQIQAALNPLTVALKASRSRELATLQGCPRPLKKLIATYRRAADDARNSRGDAQRWQARAENTETLRLMLKSYGSGPRDSYSAFALLHNVVQTLQHDLAEERRPDA